MKPQINIEVIIASSVTVVEVKKSAFNGQKFIAAHITSNRI
jgi:hypothetical protein